MASEQSPAANLGVPLVSIVIPMHNEEGAVSQLIEDISTAAQTLGNYEIIAVDDGSSDATHDRLVAIQKNRPNLRIVRHQKAGGQSAAVHSGVGAARARICCTLDGDGQNPPSNLPLLWTPLLNDTEGKIGLVAGQRIKRQDTAAKKFASKGANALREWILRDGTRDTGCGMKAFPRDVFLSMPYFDHMHRYLPALFKAYRWDIVHVDVTHAARETGESKYNNLGRAAAGIWDLLGVAWLVKRAKKVTPTEDLT